jgi:hypothetical protein
MWIELIYWINLCDSCQNWQLRVVFNFKFFSGIAKRLFPGNHLENVPEVLGNP